MTRHYVRAELLRSRYSLAMWLPAVFLVISAVSTLLSLGVNATRLASAHLYAVALLGPLAALTAIAGQRREERLRHGGTAWRNVSRSRVLAARAGVVAGYVLLGHLLMALTLTTDARTIGLFTLVNTLNFMSMWAFGLATWRFLGRAALLLGPLIAFAWSLAGAASLSMAGSLAHSTSFPELLLHPWSWAILPTLPVYGVLPNSVAAPADSPVWSLPIAAPLTLQTALGLLFFAATLLPRTELPRPSVPSRHLARRRVTTARLSTSSSLSRGLLPTLPWWTWVILATLMLVALAGVRAWRGVEIASALMCFVCVPTAATIIAVMTVTAQADAWPALMYRRVRGKIIGRLFLLDIAFLAPVLVLGMGIAAAVAPTGVGSGYRWVYQAMVTPFVAALILAVVGAVAMRSTTAAIATSVAVGAWSILVGGDALSAGPLWWTSPWAWTWTVRDYPERWVMIVLVSTIIAAIVMVLNNRLLRLKK
ncbi:hypothetical protein [Corynebacterium lactis]|uniref:Uncharacterized protein n=1 Tax=Corynebacterium lactis RW2-5 TaxID=1408189 RepID=A0A0K2H3U8_9CORY|nr:hypothetical protein [Corynebacterium lactis]ALA68376.1 hypothetical protein CLAC_01540 [Corynebacterium lactis RW2-5]